MNEQASKKAEKNAFRHREVLKRPQHTQWIRGIVCKYQKLRDDAIGVGRGIVCKYQFLQEYFFKGEGEAKKIYSTFSHSIPLKYEASHSQT